MEVPCRLRFLKHINTHRTNKKERPNRLTIINYTMVVQAVATFTLKYDDALILLTHL